MKQLPKNILVVGIIRYFDNDEIVNILKEYFNGVPHIDITEYKFNKQSIYYIIQDTYAMRSFIHRIYWIRRLNNKDRFLDYYFYSHSNNNPSVYVISSIATRMPKKIVLDYANVKKLQLLETV